ncbi:iron-containing alcohol dehydrogenase [Nocardia terpenica]|nr:iron-containing alcohol dehydrogenase [Nocardia terpenica]
MAVGTGMVAHSGGKQRPSAVHSEIPANPSTAAADVGTAVARDCRVDLVLALGGGSVLDAAKAVALPCHTDLSAESLDGSECILAPALPIAAAPTTAGTGTETNGFGVLKSADRRIRLRCRHPWRGIAAVRGGYGHIAGLCRRILATDHLRPARRRRRR